MRSWLIAVVAILLAPQLANACSCALQEGDERAAIRESLHEADVVFVGRIEGVEVLREDQSGIETQRTRFYVIQSWKGDTANRLYVETTLTCCLCGFPFPEHGEYLVYAYRSSDGSVLGTSVCTRTKLASEAAEEIAILDQLQANDETSL